MGKGHEKERAWCPCADCGDFRDAVREELRKARFELMFTLMTGEMPSDGPVRTLSR